MQLKKHNCPVNNRTVNTRQGEIWYGKIDIQNRPLQGLRIVR